MHQPHYENPITGQLELPWVRLHGTKDYYDMAAVAEAHPGVRFTINVVPSLLDQIADYVAGKRTDRYFALSRRGPRDLTADEKAFVTTNFFAANERTMIARYPRYAELHRRFKHRIPHAETAGSLFNEAELRDLIVLFNLAWIDPTFFASDLELARLAEKGQGFTEAEKHWVLDRQLAILGGIIGLYQRLWAAGRIELTVTPYYHPILPLLLDAECAREAMPNVQLPRARIQFPADFDEQVVTAIARFESTFGARPAGMWPSEGSVSDAAVRRLPGLGIRWTASDEDVLQNSTVSPGAPDPRHAYRMADAQGRELAIVFRHKRLSDLIGFSYMSWDPKEAARDFAQKVLEAAAAPARGGEAAAGGEGGEAPPLIAVILDGENCWEHYPEDGRFFLRELYGLLGPHPEIEMVTVSDYLQRYPPVRRIEHLQAGSWINHNFAIWIGHPEDNIAWELVARTRAAIESAKASLPAGDPRLATARRHLLAAEGSDWFWWFGDEHSSAHDHVFDELFRARLTAAHEALGLVPPAELGSAIKGRFGARRRDEHVPVRFMRPTLDGQVTHFYEWKLAGRVEAAKSGGAMQPVAGKLQALHYGFDRAHLYLRVDAGPEGGNETGARGPGEILAVEITQPRRSRIELDTARGAENGAVRPARLLRYENGGFVPVPSQAAFAARQVIEIEVPFAELAIKPGDTVELAVLRVEGGRTVESLPARSPVVFTAPGDDFEATMWSAS